MEMLCQRTIRLPDDGSIWSGIAECQIAGKFIVSWSVDLLKDIVFFIVNRNPQSAAESLCGGRQQYVFNDTPNGCKGIQVCESLRFHQVFGSPE